MCMYLVHVSPTLSDLGDPRHLPLFTRVRDSVNVVVDVEDSRTKNT